MLGKSDREHEDEGAEMRKGRHDEGIAALGSKSAGKIRCSPHEYGQNGSRLRRKLA